MSSFSAVRETTYGSNYTFVKGYPVPKFHDYVSFVLQTEDKLIPRCFPHYYLHISPHRILQFERSNLGFGPTGSEYKNSKGGVKRPGEIRRIHDRSDSKKKSSDFKNNIHTKQSQPEKVNESAVKCKVEGDSEEALEDSKTTKNDGPILNKFPREITDEVTRGIYKSTARRAAEECPLPVPTRPAALPQILGTNEDREIYHSVYRRTGSWKANTVPEFWERSQERPLCEDPKRCRPCRLRVSTSKRRLLRRSQQVNNVMQSRYDMEKKMQPGTATDVHVRPAPGYGGFVPKLPVVSNPTRDPRLALSLSTASYRKFPSQDLKILEYAHKGPLSKLVTTTSPCNPFKNGTVCPDHLFVY